MMTSAGRIPQERRKREERRRIPKETNTWLSVHRNREKERRAQIKFLGKTAASTLLFFPFSWKRTLEDSPFSDLVGEVCHPPLLSSKKFANKETFRLPFTNKRAQSRRRQLSTKTKFTSRAPSSCNLQDFLKACFNLRGSSSPVFSYFGNITVSRVTNFDKAHFQRNSHFYRRYAWRSRNMIIITRVERQFLRYQVRLTRGVFLSSY